MKRRYLILALITAAWAIALAAVAKNAIDRLNVPPWGNPMADSTSAPLAGDTRVGQAFVAPMDGLYRIEVVLVPAPEDTDRPLILHLTAGPTAQEDLYTAEFSTTEIDPATALGFEFGPIRDSKGREFFFYLESPGTDLEEAPSVRFSPNSTLEPADAYLNGEPLAGDLAFHSFYTLRTRDKVGLLLSRMTEDRPYLMGSEAFYLVLAAAYVLVLGAFLYKLGSQVAGEEDKDS
jgi:hypothetical protein